MRRILPLVCLSAGAMFRWEVNHEWSREPIHEEWFQQLIHHPKINPKDRQKGTFNQRFFRAGKENSKLAVLLVGGEEEMSSRQLRLSIATHVARNLSISAYALEHRYYGQSWPTPNLNTTNLRYLTTRHALMDLKRFMLKYAQKWVLIGGSYGGTLASQARVHFPDLVIGAVASSSPIRPKEDFEEFDLSIQVALKKAGGPNCLRFHQEIADDIDQEILAGNSSAIKAMFGCPHLADSHFVDELTFVASIIQNHSPSRIRDYCSRLDPNLPKQKRLVLFSNRFKEYKNGTECTAPSTLDDIHERGFLRQWVYQCCTEYGFWQTSPKLPSLSSRSRLLDLNYYRKNYCDSIFKQKLPFNPPPPINNFTNILFTNGELDPWAALSHSNITLHNTTHSADLDIPFFWDPLPLRSVKFAILDTIATFFNFFLLIPK